MACILLGEGRQSPDGQVGNRDAKVPDAMVETGRFSLMIADDDDAWRMTLHDVFEPRGFRVYLASNGREALSVIERQRIDCMLLDMHMPELSGLETLQLVRRRKLLLPCIMVTADSSVHLRQRALSLRAFRVLTKPVSRELVTVTVEEALQSSSAAS